MQQKVNITAKIDNWKLKVNLEVLNSELLLKDAEILLYAKVLVYFPNGLNKSEELYRKKFIVAENQEFIIELWDRYTYLWTAINMFYEVEVIFNDSFFIDTNITKNIKYNLVKPNLNLPLKETNLYKLNSLSRKTDKDNLNFFENFIAVPPTYKIIFIILELLFLFIGWTIYNTLLHNENVHILINNSLLIIFLLLFVIIPFFIMFSLIKNKYMTFYFIKRDKTFSKDWVYKLKDIINWKTRVDLENVEIKIIAFNSEKWQYTVSSSRGRRGRRRRSKRIENFSIPINKIELFKSEFSFIPKNVDIWEYIDWEVSFKELYEKLIPEYLISSNHWLALNCEVQLISDKFADQKFIIPFDYFNRKLFSKENFINDENLDIELKNEWNLRDVINLMFMFIVILPLSFLTPFVFIDIGIGTTLSKWIFLIFLIIWAVILVKKRNKKL